MIENETETRQKQTTVLLKASPIFWQVLKRILKGSTFSALAYNGLVAVITDWYSAEKTGEIPKIAYALSRSRIRELPSSASMSLTKVCEEERSNLYLTSTQRRTLTMVLQKLNESDFA